MPCTLCALQMLGQDTTLPEQGFSYQGLWDGASWQTDYKKLRNGALCDYTPENLAN